MLNKDICQKCRIRIARNSKIKALKISDLLWKKGKLICNASSGFGSVVYVNEIPPDKCPYILEHIVNKGKINAK